MVPETVTVTSLWFGGHKVVGSAAAVMVGGVVSPPATSKVCTELLLMVGFAVLVATTVMESSVPNAADAGTNRLTVTVPVAPLGSVRDEGETEVTKNWLSVAARLKVSAAPLFCTSKTSETV